MVAPLAVLALVWDTRDWGRTRLFGDWGLTVRLGSRRRRIAGPALLSGGLLAAMGVLTIGFALRGPEMKLSGWQLQVSAWLGHASAVLQHHLGWLPGWAGLLLLIASVAGFVRGARSRHGVVPQPSETPMSACSRDGRVSKPAAASTPSTAAQAAQVRSTERIH